jgi:hypothetical protein
MDKRLLNDVARWKHHMNKGGGYTITELAIFVALWARFHRTKRHDVMKKPTGS